MWRLIGTMSKSICKTDIHGNRSWWVGDKRHREDGHAFEDEMGYRSWWVNGKRHREDGPACEFALGRRSWYIHGERYTEEEFKKYQLTKQLAGI